MSSIVQESWQVTPRPAGHDRGDVLVADREPACEFGESPLSLRISSTSSSVNFELICEPTS
jgi:hypothetical protein